MAIKNIFESEIESTYDICIVGSGPAGMTLAAELSDTGKRVCVLESGGEKPSEYGNALREVKSVGEIKIKTSSRERVLGGTSTTWGGGSAPLDEIDLSLRDYLTHPSCWPFGISELTPYYERASAYGFPPSSMFTAGQLDAISLSGDMTFTHAQLEEKIFIATDPPWNFGKKLRHIFDKSNIDLYLDATVLYFASEKNEGALVRATCAHIVSSNGVRSKISADIFVIAAGGIESARLLLLSRDSVPQGLGNEHDQVGRYLMNHPKNSFGSIRLKKPIRNLPYFFGFFRNGFAGYAGIRLHTDVQESLKVLNSYVRFEPIFPWSDNVGVWSFLTIIKKLKFFINFWKKQQKHIVHLRDYNETPDGRHADESAHRFSVMRACIDIVLHIQAVSEYLYYRLFPSKAVFVKNIRLRNFMEMEPRPENRITLGNTLDTNGQEQVIVDINTSPLDRHSLVVLHHIFASEIKKNGIGILEGDFETEKSWPITFDASHHLGGTRMGEDPTTSVVRSDLRVHSVSNLYVCSGSVFPTSGCANPTYTICALAIRLADTLKK